MIDIVIVNWNAGDQLRDCLLSIIAHGDGLVASVVVVDNGSTDGSADISISRLPLTIVKTGHNLGFGAACNLGAARGSAPFVLFLNPDAELRAGVLSLAVAPFDERGGHDLGVVGIRLVDREGVAHRHAARFPTWRSFVGNSIGLFRIGRGYFKPIPLEEFDHLTDRTVDHVMGAFYLIRRSLFDALHGFDEAFFVYMEDLDLSRRVADAGWRVDYLAGPSAYHKQGGTSDQIKARRLSYVLGSNIVYAWKHRPVIEAIAVTGITLTLEPISRIARFALQRRGEEALATAHGFAMLYAALPDIARRVRRARAAPRPGPDSRPR